jgi:hypothetical protein
MARRLPETLADYLVVAIAPILIGTLVGSLMYFLVFAFYGGEQTFLLLWVLTFFLLGVVGIARLAIEEGRAYASLFAFALAGALSIVLPPTAWPLLALVWWATHKLTWDCTLVDENQDASGQGLLQQIGLEASDSHVGQRGPSLASATSSAASPETPTIQDGFTEPKQPPATWLTRLWQPDKKPHAPGVWVVYFSLAALPLFGLGGWFITDAGVRHKAFWLLVIYVASGMSLLAATSFLGLRRYLRQRRIEMPLEMTATWLTTGALLIAAMLLLATVLPRPGREYSLSQIPFAVASTVKKISNVKKASKLTVLPEGIKDSSQKKPTATNATDESQSVAKKGSGKNQPGDQKSDNDSKSSANGKQSEKGNQSDSGKDKSSKSSDRESSKQDKAKNRGKSESSSSKSEAKQEQESEQKSTDNQQSTPPLPDQSAAAQSSPGQTLSQITSNFTQAISWIIRLVFYAAILIGGLVMIVVYREQLLAALRKLLDELRELWAWWFGPIQRASPAAEPTVVIPARPFSSFHDPFASGAAKTMSWMELVNYSFAAAEAWALENRFPRQPGQTPLEFADQLARAVPEIADPAQSLARSYSQLAYSKHAASAGPAESLRRLWQVLSAPSAAHAAAAPKAAVRS